MNADMPEHANRRGRGRRRAAGCAGSPCRPAPRSSALISSPKRARPNRSACRRMAAGSNAVSMAARDRVGKRLGAGVVDEEAGLAVHDRLERAAAAERDHRPAARLRFERHDAEVFFAGQQHDRRAPVQRRASRRRTRGRETRTVAGAARRVRARARSGPSPTIFSGTPASAAGVNGDVDALVGHERRHDEREPLGRGRIGMEELGVDGRIHHSRLAIIVSADPARNIMRDSDIAVRAVRRVAVPARQPRHHRPHQPRCRAGPAVRGRSRRRTGPRRSASASGSSRDAARVRDATIDFAQQWLMLTTRSKRSKENCSIAVGKSGR